MPEFIKDFLNAWGQNNIVAGIVIAILSSLLTLTFVFFSRIIDFIISMSKWLGAIISKRGKDYAFEKAYLTWIINQHRYLGLLPARVVAARWGEEGRNVDLEKVYVSLHVSAQGEIKTLKPLQVLHLPGTNNSGYMQYPKTLFGFILSSFYSCF